MIRKQVWIRLEIHSHALTKRRIWLREENEDWKPETLKPKYCIRRSQGRGWGWGMFPLKFLFGGGGGIIYHVATQRYIHTLYQKGEYGCVRKMKRLKTWNTTTEILYSAIPGKGVGVGNVFLGGNHNYIMLQHKDTFTRFNKKEYMVAWGKIKRLK